MSKFIYLFVGLTLLFQCTSTEETADSTDEIVSEEPSTTDRVQAVLHIQDKSYDNTQKSVIDTDYTPRKSIVVPNDLDPQNKWVKFEGPILENDVIAYRFYMDSRHRFDIFGKLTENLVMDTVGWQYHDIMNWGSDILKVGNSLGIGSPAFYLNDEVITFSEFDQQTVTVTQDDQETACVTTIFEGLTIGQETINLAEEWCLSAGSPVATVKLTILEGQLPENASWATGVVKHLPNYELVESEDKVLLYTWGKQSFHEENMGMAVQLHRNSSYEYVENEATHLLVVEATEQPFVYHFAAAWERDVMNVKSGAAFKEMLLVNK